MRSWGRDDAEAELWALLVQAITATASSRTTDQQNAVAWLSAVVQRQAVQAANNAGLEYVKWAGLDQSQYQTLLASNPSQSSHRHRGPRGEKRRCRSAKPPSGWPSAGTVPSAAAGAHAA